MKVERENECYCLIQNIPNRYVEPAGEDGAAPRDEQRRWEEEHMGAAKLRFGAKDSLQRNPQREYDLVLPEDDMIEFVSSVTMHGNVMQVKFSAQQYSFTFFFVALNRQFYFPFFISLVIFFF